MNNVVMFSIRGFWRMLYIYYKEKVTNLIIRANKHIHFEILKIKLVATYHKDQPTRTI